jgi:hypothetical protein
MFRNAPDNPITHVQSKRWDASSRALTVTFQESRLAGNIPKIWGYGCTNPLTSLQLVLTEECTQAFCLYLGPSLCSLHCLYTVAVSFI